MIKKALWWAPLFVIFALIDFQLEHHMAPNWYTVCAVYLAGINTMWLVVQYHEARKPKPRPQTRTKPRAKPTPGARAILPQDDQVLKGGHATPWRRVRIDQLHTMQSRLRFLEAHAPQELLDQLDRADAELAGRTEGQ
jgi:hypothetical protein